jgi:hypothetical protein
LFGEIERGIRTDGGGEDMRCARGDIWLTGTLGKRLSNLLFGDNNIGDFD